jgi:hypothetical protein
MDRLPQQYIQPQLAGMAPGTSGWTVPWAMEVDGHGRGFLNGRYALYPAPEGTATMHVERVAQGYRVTIPPGERWRPSAYAPGWAGLPVVEVQEASDGQQ